jgi:dTDP-4-amino-4,6-dideoxygalactose transaminase
MRVPSKDYARQYQPLLGELLAEVQRVLLEDEPILGATLVAFEREFATWLGCAHAIGLNSGTDALVLALRALRLPPGGEVIVPANTFFATVGAVVMAGLRPVLVEPDPATMNLDPAAVAAALSPRTVAILPVHLYGLLCPMAAISALAARARVPIVEDVAQAHGAHDMTGKRAGTFGVAGCFSFHPSKNLGAFGDGGAVTTDDPALRAEFDLLRNLGKTSKHDIARVTGNSKLDTLQAAILRVKLRHLDGWVARRRQLAAIYDARLRGLGDLVLPLADPGHAYHLYVVRTAHRDRLRAHLETRGVTTSLHYKIPPHLQELDVDLGYRRGQLPITERLADTLVSLPVSHELTDAEIEYVCDGIVEVFRG